MRQASLCSHVFRPLVQRSASGSFPTRRATPLPCWSFHQHGRPSLVPRWRGCRQHCREPSTASAVRISDRGAAPTFAKTASADGIGRDPPICASYGSLTAPTLRDLDAAEQARLAYIDRGSHRLAFRHPLIRAAVVDLATADDRREANRGYWPSYGPISLTGARGISPRRRSSPMKTSPPRSRRAAHRVLARGDVVASVAALTRSAELSPLTRDRNRRLAAAAYIGMDVTGELRSASRVMDEVRRVDPELKGSLQAAGTAAAVLLNADGDVDTAHRLLVDAIESRAASTKPSDTELTDALHTLLQVCYAGGREELWSRSSVRSPRLAPDIPAGLYLGSMTLADPLRTPAAVLEQLSKEIDGLGQELDPTRIVRLAIACNFVDRVPGCRQALWRVRARRA